METEVVQYASSLAIYGSNSNRTVSDTPTHLSSPASEPDPDKDKEAPQQPPKSEARNAKEAERQKLRSPRAAPGRNVTSHRRDAKKDDGAGKNGAENDDIPGVDSSGDVSKPEVRDCESEVDLSCMSRLMGAFGRGSRHPGRRAGSGASRAARGDRQVKPLDPRVIKRLRGKPKSRDGKKIPECEESEVMIQNTDDEDDELEIWDQSDAYSAAGLSVDDDWTSRIIGSTGRRLGGVVPCPEGSEMLSEDVIDLQRDQSAVIFFAPGTLGAPHDLFAEKQKTSTPTKGKPVGARNTPLSHTSFLQTLFCLPTRWLHLLIAIFDDAPHHGDFEMSTATHVARHEAWQEAGHVSPHVSPRPVTQPNGVQSKESRTGSEGLVNITLEDDDDNRIELKTEASASDTTFGFNSEAEREICSDGEDELFLSSKFDDIFRPKLELQLSRTTLTTIASLHVHGDVQNGDRDGNEQKQSFMIWPPGFNHLCSVWIRSGQKTNGLSAPIAYQILDSSCPLPRKRNFPLCYKRHRDLDIFQRELEWKMKAASRRRTAILDAIRRKQVALERRRQRTRERKRERILERRYSAGDGLYERNLDTIEEGRSAGDQEEGDLVFGSSM